MDDAVKNIKPFEIENVPANELRNQWDDYKKQFMYAAKTFSKNKRKNIKSIFLSLAGRPLQKVYEDICRAESDNEDEEEEEDECEAYKLMMTRLDKYFQPKQHDIMERHEFWSMKLKEGERLDKFIVRATSQLGKCNFGNSRRESRDIALVDKIVMMAPPDLKKEILKTSAVSVDELMRIVRTNLNAQLETTTLNTTSTVGTSLNQTINHIGGPSSRRYRDNDMCSRCGYRSHAAGRVCPAVDKKCNNCSKVGHFAQTCRASKPNYTPKPTDENNKRKNESKSGGAKKRRRVYFVESGDSEDEIVNCIV